MFGVMHHPNVTFFGGKKTERLIKLQMIQPVKYHVLFYYFFFLQIIPYKIVSN